MDRKEDGPKRTQARPQKKTGIKEHGQENPPVRVFSSAQKTSNEMRDKKTGGDDKKMKTGAESRQ